MDEKAESHLSRLNKTIRLTGLFYMIKTTANGRKGSKKNIKTNTIHVYKDSDFYISSQTLRKIK